ncbi:MAG: hypothetical protein ACR2NC_01960 [Thermodesulfobacteriota bacterium]
MNLRSKIKFIFLAFFLIGLVTGCVYLRFLKVKNQMADFNKNFEITEENGLSLNFLNPVLKKKDMVWLMGTEPTIKESEGDPSVWVYELKKRYRGKTTEKKIYDIPLRLKYENNRLTALTLPERFTKYFSKSLFEKFLQTFGEAEISKEDRQASSKYEGADKSEIPSTKEILAVLGKPYYNRVEGEERTYVYRYKILSPDPDKDLGVKIIYHFNKETNLLNSVEANIKGLKVLIEFTKLTNKNN